MFWLSEQISSVLYRVLRTSTAAPQLVQSISIYTYLYLLSIIRSASWLVEQTRRLLFHFKESSISGWRPFLQLRKVFFCPLASGTTCELWVKPNTAVPVNQGRANTHVFVERKVSLTSYSAVLRGVLGSTLVHVVLSYVFTNLSTTSLAHLSLCLLHWLMVDVAIYLLCTSTEYCYRYYHTYINHGLAAAAAAAVWVLGHYNNNRAEHAEWQRAAAVE